MARVDGDGSVLARTVDTARSQDAGRWIRLAEDAALYAPPPYRPAPGEAVYRIQAGGIAALVAERDLQGPLLDLTVAVLAEGNSWTAEGDSWSAGE